MRKPQLTLFYQFDPWNPSVGGIQTLVSSFLKYIPDEFSVRFVGISADPEVTPGQWHAREFSSKKIQFFPLLHLESDNVRGKIPTSVKYTLALIGRNFSSDFMHFYRLEYNLAALNWQGEKTLFVQNDILQQLNPKAQKKTILWQRFPKAYFRLERSLLGQFDQILSCNENSANFYRKQYPFLAERVTYFTNTVDTSTFKPLSPRDKRDKSAELAEKLKLTHLSQLVLFAGRLHPQKDPVLLVQAMALVKNPDAHLLIAGDGELSDAVRIEINRLGLTHRITLLGAVSQAYLLTLYQVSKLFILTSVYEGLPFAALEALACGIPVVTTKAGDLPNLITSQNGIVCHDRSPDTIAKAVTKILEYPLAFPVSKCKETSRPYSAEIVIGKVYESMLETWSRQNNLSNRSVAE